MKELKELKELKLYYVHTNWNGSKVSLLEFDGFEKDGGYEITSTPNSSWFPLGYWFDHDEVFTSSEAAIKEDCRDKYNQVNNHLRSIDRLLKSVEQVKPLKPTRKIGNTHVGAGVQFVTPTRLETVTVGANTYSFNGSTIRMTPAAAEF